MLRWHLIVFAWILAAGAAFLPAPNIKDYHPDACADLEHHFPRQVLYNGTDEYFAETRFGMWSASSVKDPACVFVPHNATDIIHAITTFNMTNTHFAIRGGGHSPVLDSNSIYSPGVMLVLSKLKSLSFDNDTQILSVGAGNRWQDVYDYLEPYGRVAVGGRSGHIGVSGLLLGGGISFYGSQYGFASNNVVKYECVLANGTIAEVTATNCYSDLFWALKAGGNSFCIVTSFHLRTFDSPEIFIGTQNYSSIYTSQFLDAVASWAKDGSVDSKASLISTVETVPFTNATTYRALQFYDSSTDNPKIWENFTFPNMGALYSDYKRQSLATYTRNDVSTAVPGTRAHVWRSFTSIANRADLGLIQDNFLAMTEQRLARYEGVTASISFHPITAEFISRSQENGGTPHGLKFDRAPLFITALQVSCLNYEEYVAVHDFTNLFLKSVTKALASVGTLEDFVSMNHAGEGQNIFETYGHDNLAQLEELQRRYDPLNFYTDIMPGGSKLPAAVARRGE